MEVFPARALDRRPEAAITCVEETHAIRVGVHAGDCIVTKEYTPLEPDVAERKYCRG